MGEFKIKGPKFKIVYLLLASCSLFFVFNCLAFGEDSLYAQMVQERIAQSLVLPDEIEDNNLPARVKLRLLISSNGELEKVIVCESSGNRMIDELAKTTAQKIAPYPPLPSELKLDRIWLDVPIVYCREAMDQVIDDNKSETQRERSPVKDIEKVWTLGDCFKVALANSQPVQIAQKQIRLASIKVCEARRELFPKLVGEYRSSEGETITEPFESKSYGLELEQPIYDGGRRVFTLRQEKLSFDMARANYQKVRNDLGFKLAEAYYSLIGTKLIEVVQKDLLEDGKGDLELARRLHEADLSIQSEFLDVESLFGEIRHRLTSAEDMVALAKLTLQQALNIDPAEVVEMPSEFDRPVKDLGIMVQECIKMGLKWRPEIQIAKLAISSSRYRKKVAERENWPNLSLVSSYGKSGEAFAPEEITMVEEWSIMGKVSWLFGGSSVEYSLTEDMVAEKKVTDVSVKTESTTRSIKASLLDRLDYYSKKKEADIIYRQSLSDLNEQRQKVDSEIEEAFLGYKRAILGVNMTSERVKFRRAELKVLKARLNLAEVDISDVLEARMELAEAQSSYIQSVTNYHLAVASLINASGYALGL